MEVGPLGREMRPGLCARRAEKPFRQRISDIIKSLPFRTDWISQKVVSMTSPISSEGGAVSGTLRLAMLGMIPGNGHPYSWSAIINGYDPEAMARCPYPVIPQYLGAQPIESVCVHGAEVTHVWTDDPSEAGLVAAAAKIRHVVARPEDVIGEVDGVIIATDDGTDHVRRARPFVEAGLPVFVDKPLATTREELAQFSAWRKAGARILSSSGLRYAPAVAELRGQEWRWITSLTCKSWERYGIHALEPVYTILGSGFVDVRNESQEGSDIVHCRHRSGAQATIAAIHDAYGSFGVIHAYGEKRSHSIRMQDTYRAFRGQMLAVVDWMRTGLDPYPFAETRELMAILIAGQESRSQGGARIAIEPLLETL